MLKGLYRASENDLVKFFYFGLYLWLFSYAVSLPAYDPLAVLIYCISPIFCLVTAYVMFKKGIKPSLRYVKEDICKLGLITSTAVFVFPLGVLILAIHIRFLPIWIRANVEMPLHFFYCFAFFVLPVMSILITLAKKAYYSRGR